VKYITGGCMKNLKLLALLMTTGIALSGINAANAEVGYID
jgi:hypothetical protein